MCTVQIYLLGGEQRAAQYMVEFLRGQVRPVTETRFVSIGVCLYIACNAARFLFVVVRSRCMFSLLLLLIVVCWFYVHWASRWHTISRCISTMAMGAICCLCLLHTLFPDHIERH